MLAQVAFYARTGMRERILSRSRGRHRGTQRIEPNRRGPRVGYNEYRARIFRAFLKPGCCFAAVTAMKGIVMIRRLTQTPYNVVATRAADTPATTGRDHACCLTLPAVSSN
jgi:hypothetical protein